MHQCKSLVLIIFILFSVIACKKDEIVSPVEKESLFTIKTIFQDSGTYSIFSYEDNRLIKYESYADGTLDMSIIIYYQSNGNLEKEKYQWGAIHFIKYFNYDANNIMTGWDLKIEDNYNASIMIASSYRILKYNLKGLLEREEEYGGSTNQITVSYEHKYDSFERLIETKEYSRDTLYSITTYSYDSMRNPWQVYDNILFSYRTKSTNNVTSVKNTYYNDGIISKSDEDSYSYEYDKNGYPNKEILIRSLNGIRKTYERVYKYN